MFVSVLPSCTRNLDNFQNSSFPVDKCPVVPALSTALYLDRKEKWKRSTLLASCMQGCGF